MANWDYLEADQVQLLMRNGHQMLDIITATFGSELSEDSLTDEACVKPASDHQELACEWRAIANLAPQVVTSEGLDAEFTARVIRVSS